MPGHEAISIEAQRTCSAIVKARAKHFYYGLALTPQPKRSAIYAIYAWMRQADDIVDEPMEMAERRSRFATFCDASRRVLDGETPSDRVLEAVAFAQRTFGLPRSIFEDMLSAMEMDLSGLRVDTWATYERYCQGVAVSAGEAAVLIWGTRPGAREQALKLARQAGLAFQTTNILRDIQEDQRLGRVYIPLELLASHGLDHEGFLAMRNQEACLAVLRVMVEQARLQYRSAEGLLDLLEPTCTAAYFGMHTMYRRVLELVAKDPLAALRGQRVSIRKRTKLAIAGRALLKSWTEGR
jgi:15-cis-phytoene synthase